MINRNLYLEELKRHVWKGNVKVITGIRRCGKSTLLFNLFKNYLISSGIKASNIIEIKLDNMEEFNLRNLPC